MLFGLLTTRLKLKLTYILYIYLLSWLSISYWAHVDEA